MDWDALFKLFGPGAIFIVAVAALWRLVFTPRKGRNAAGREVARSAIVVPGWQHDSLIDEIELVRLARDRREEDLRQDFDTRVKEWRRLRDEERVRAAESDSRLREMDKRLDRFDSVLDQMLGLLTELAERARPNRGP